MDSAQGQGPYFAGWTEERCVYYHHYCRLPFFQTKRFHQGSYWKRHTISFTKIKLTNRDSPTSRTSPTPSESDSDSSPPLELPSGHFHLRSFHRYQPRVHLFTHASGGRGEVERVTTFVWRETTFVAVTHYQNEEVNWLKKNYNPHAKGFKVGLHCSCNQGEIPLQSNLGCNDRYIHNCRITTLKSPHRNSSIRPSRKTSPECPPRPLTQPTKPHIATPLQFHLPPLPSALAPPAAPVLVLLNGKKHLPSATLRDPSKGRKSLAKARKVHTKKKNLKKNKTTHQHQKTNQAPPNTSPHHSRQHSRQLQITCQAHKLLQPLPTGILILLYKLLRSLCRPRRNGG